MPGLVPIIQSKRARVLVMPGRNNEAKTANRLALPSRQNLTPVFSIAYFNKANALKNLGKIDEAQTAYAKAYELDDLLFLLFSVPLTVDEMLVSWDSCEIIYFFSQRAPHQYDLINCE